MCIRDSVSAAGCPEQCQLENEEQLAGLRHRGQLRFTQRPDHQRVDHVDADGNDRLQRHWHRDQQDRFQ